MKNEYERIYEKLECKADKVNFLTGLLSSSVSPVGDWKVIKCYEARMNGKEDPYDFTALTTARQQVRDEINAVQALPDDEEVPSEDAPEDAPEGETPAEEPAE